MSPRYVYEVGEAVGDGYTVVEVLGHLQAEVSRAEGRLRLVRIGPQGGRYVFVQGDADQARDVAYLLDVARKVLVF